MKEKCVLVVRNDLDKGLQMNAAVILGICAGALRPDLNGPAAADESGRLLHGIVTIPVPVLAAGREAMESLRRETSFVFTDIAQGSRTYEEYRRKQGQADGQALGLLLLGPEKRIRKLTGHLPLAK
ncbi:DUF2000 domain-containing protein [Faecalibaculum rodentium]|uniref:DUF2000 domain-containing protein n=1 Tax=Faecalibaculum rodentium TaxID=1702221 RepID=UPI0023F04DEE|nr:DUF2000 domain-containing protein [Faecalibaculum rodentium]